MFVGHQTGLLQRVLPGPDDIAGIALPEQCIVDWCPCAHSLLFRGPPVVIHSEFQLELPKE
ncbi:hypothetical protein HYALB_00007204 [Hymenoscyphus albidus]|uniref:Uncharacterized protein n=1 Tax=Hymenoscyphus albidus TaxID=595503 RepID=A0A9N9LG50_9HELO|nr:hypothetical protein HYALB_00007204 [Hymenoscyphus albidus]